LELKDEGKTEYRISSGGRMTKDFLNEEHTCFMKRA